MIRTLFLLYFLMMMCASFAQEGGKATKSFTVSGRVKSPKTFTWQELGKFSIHNLGDVAITNHKGESKGTAKELSGILLTQILDKVELDAESPKILSEYYFICRASDGYKVVYSWNELFNTTTGNSVYIVTSKDHKSMDTSDDNILMISTHDIRTGRRYIKNLETITVARVE
jgi:hypothetical protein